MESELKVLHPVVEVTVNGLGAVEVREMRWKPALAFVEKLSGVLSELMDGGKLVITAENLAGVIMRSSSLATELIVRSTSLSTDKVDDLYPSDALALLKAAIEVNLHEDLLGKGREVGRVLGAVLGVKPAAGDA